MGQEPGSERTTCGCIGHTYSVLAAGATFTGSRAIPHFGHTPGFSLRISGCMGHVKSPTVGWAFDSDAPPSMSRWALGSALNFWRQLGLQNQYVDPPWSTEPAALAGKTDIPHTGSFWAGAG
jgi:hypothetical protein